MKSPRKLIQHVKNRMRLDPRSFRLYTVLRALVIVSAVRSFLMRNYESFALCILSLLLFLLPALLEETLKIEIPTLFEIFIYLFIYEAEILGEVNKFYTAIPGWDTMLHTINGFLCAAIGFSLVEILNRTSKRLNLSPIYVAIVAFCFSMTVGVCWEFIEFFFDQVFHFDMQKDFIVTAFSSCTLDPNKNQTPIYVFGITKTIIETKSGQTVTIDGGYLDIGIIDTMKDLLVNFVGALTFSIIGYFNEKSRNTKSLAQRLRLTPLTDEEIREQNAFAEEQAAARKEARHEKKNKKMRDGLKQTGNKIKSDFQETRQDFRDSGDAIREINKTRREKKEKKS